MAWSANALRTVVRALVAVAVMAPCVARATDWRASIQAVGVVDGESRWMTPLTFGVTVGASEAFDRGADLLAPPPPPGERHVEAYLHRPEDSPFYRRLNTDMRGEDTDEDSAWRWEVVVVNSTDAEWVLSWDVSGIPDEWGAARLVGERDAVDMRETSSVPVPASGSHVYTITVSRDPVSELTQAVVTPAEQTPLDDARTDDVGQSEQPGDEADRGAEGLDEAPEAAAVAAPGDPSPVPPLPAPEPTTESAFENDEPDGVAAVTPSVTPSAEVVVERILGDVTGDGVVGIEDIVWVARRVGGVASEGDPADVDGDGAVTIRDLVCVAVAMGTTTAAPSRVPLTRDIERLASGEMSPEEFVLGIVEARPRDRARLLPNYPNPFNPETWIPYELAAPGVVAVTVYDTAGAVVRRLDLGYRESGVYRRPSRAAHWDGRTDSGDAAASGSYIVSLNVGSEVHRRRIILVK